MPKQMDRATLRDIANYKLPHQLDHAGEVLKQSHIQINSLMNKCLTYLGVLRVEMSEQRQSNKNKRQQSFLKYAKVILKRHVYYIVGK